MLRLVLGLLASSVIFPAGAGAQSAALAECPTIVATRPTVVPAQRYRAGDVVPPFAVDEPLHWVECPRPEFPAGASRDTKKRAFLFITVDEKGTVVDVKPRGAIDPEGYFDAAVAAIRKWKSTAPRWKTLAVRCAFAADIIFDSSQPAPPAAEPSPAQPAAPAPAPTGSVAEAAAPPATTPVQTEKPAPAPTREEPKPAPIQEPPVTQAPAPQVVAPPKEEPKPAPALSPPSSATANTRATSPAEPPANSTPQPTAPAAAPAPAPAVEEKPAEPARPCPQFFVLPESEQSRRTYRAGELVPNAYLDEKPLWVQCPWPDFSGTAARTASVIVVIDDRGVVREVRPRGQPANIAFQRTRAALTGWRIAPPPRYKSLPVWTSTALDIRNDGTAQRAAEQPPASSPAAPAATIPLPAAPAAQGAQSAGGEAPFVEEFYYKAKWGFADEFWRLFLKNHWPILRKEMEMGCILEVHAEKPVYHASEDSRWDYRVTIVWRSTAARFADFDTPALERQLFPDQETFHREEQRRFEILLAHWDVPVQAVKLEK